MSCDVSASEVAADNKLGDVKVRGDVLTVHIMDLLLINEGEICRTDADADHFNLHNVLYTIRLCSKYSGDNYAPKFHSTSNKRKLRRTITWDEKFSISTCDKTILEITLIKNESAESIYGTAVLDVSKEYLNNNDTKVMIISLSNENNLDYNGLLIKSKLRVGISKKETSSESTTIKRNCMKTNKLNPIRRKNTIDYMALMTELFLVSIPGIESEKFCSANTFIEFVKTFLGQKILIDIELIASNVISRSIDSSVDKSSDETLLSPYDKLKLDVEKSCKFIDETLIVYFEYDTTFRFINSLDKSKIINYTEGTITDIDINKSIIELQNTLSDYSNELTQTEDYFTEINKAIVNEKIITDTKVEQEAVATTDDTWDLEDSLPIVDITASETKAAIIDKLCNTLAYKKPDISYTLMKTKLAKILELTAAHNEDVKPLVKNLRNMTEVISQYLSLNSFYVPLSDIPEDLNTSSTTVITAAVKDVNSKKKVNTLDGCTRNMVMSVINECCKRVETNAPRSNIIISTPPRKIMFNSKNTSRTLQSSEHHGYHAIFAITNILHQCYKDKESYKIPYLDDCAHYNRILKTVCDLFDGGFDPLIILLTAFITKFDSIETAKIEEFINWLSGILIITDFELNNGDITRKILLKDEKRIFENLIFGDDEIASFLSYCKRFEENDASLDLTELNAILDNNSFLEKMIFDDGSLLHLAVKNDLKKLTEVIISRDILDLDIRDKQKHDYSWYARNNLDIQKSILTGKRNRGV